MNLPSLGSKKPRPQSVCDLAFFHGSQGVDLKPGLEELQATFDRRAAEINHDAVAREKKFETVLDSARRLLPAAEERAQKVNERLGHRTPQLFLPLMAAITGNFMAIAEVLMLAPALDVLNITNPILQIITATGIMLASCWAYHFAWESFTSDRFPRIWRITIRIIALTVTLALSLWGVLRGRQVAFAANLNGNPLGAFLSGHPLLASAFYVFVTLITPLVVATTMHYAFHHLREWWEWKTANAKASHLSQTCIEAQKKLDTEREQHEQQLKKLAHECAEWKSAYRIHHERGTLHKAVKEPMALVVAKACLAALVAGVALFWAPPLLTGFAVVASGIAAFLHFRRKREHPTAEQYARVHKVEFAPNAYSVQAKEPPVIEAQTVQRGRRRKGLLP